MHQLEQSTDRPVDQPTSQPGSRPASQTAMPLEPEKPRQYDRLGNLKKAFFDIFADHTQEPVQLDYVAMVGGLGLSFTGCFSFMQSADL